MTCSHLFPLILSHGGEELFFEFPQLFAVLAMMRITVRTTLTENGEWLTLYVPFKLWYVVLSPEIYRPLFLLPTDRARVSVMRSSE